MNLMHHLNLVEKKLTSLTRFEKIQLYAIPLLIVIFILYHFTDLNIQKKSKNITQLETSNINTYDFLNRLQEFANIHELSILNIKQNGLNFSLNLQGEFNSIFQFIFFCETYKTINELKIIKLIQHQKNIDLEIQFEFSSNKYLLANNEKKLWEKVFIYDPFSNKKSVKKKKFILNAIVNKEALINNVWLKKGDTVEGYTIKNIQAHFVELTHQTQGSMILKLLKE